MHKKLTYTIILLAVFFQQNLYSQSIQAFSEDTGQFPGELISYMGSNLAELQSVRLNEFITLWDSAMFSNEEMNAVIKSSNLLLSHNARPVPHMINYADLLIEFAENDPGRQNYPAWQKAFMSILGKDDVSLTMINEFMISSRRLISENLLFSSRSVSWEAGSTDFRMVFNDSLQIVFSGSDLMAYNHIDTLIIFNTSGTLCLLTNTWKGEGGKVTWERTGLDADEAYAFLDRYTIDMTKPDYIADSAMFVYSRYFQTPMSGRLTDRVLSTNNMANASYPRFTSYRQEFNINSIYRDVDYEGGLSMEGAKLIGSGSEQHNARLFFYREGERWLTAESSHFVFQPQGVSSTSSGIIFFLENDSVFHPDMYLNYINNTRELSLNHNQKVISQSPWYNKFHQVDMSFAQLLWKIDEPQMRLTMPRASSIGNANFESLNFFDRNQYLRLQGMDSSNPLWLLKKFADEYDYYNMPAEEYARFLRMPLPQIRRQLLELTLQGFIFYDSETDRFRLRERLYHYLQANIRRVDYDVINFASTTNAPTDNAVLDLETFDMQINGIPRVFISNRQNVNIFPGNNTVTLKRNRNFHFDGTINAGNLSFFGDNFTFDYDDFYINLQHVDSISLRAWLDGTEREDQERLAEVRNLIRNVTGELYIDEPDNKSGRIYNQEFPKFRSNDNSYVFYEKPHIQEGVYKSENFYFELEPFFMDSLNTFRNEDLRFEGKLVSAGIFPDIEEMLTLQDDFSLGIKHSLPRSGIPAYEGKGVFYDHITLSNEGLRGRGRLEYITSVLYSDDFLFLPDSMNTYTSDFRMSKQTAGTEFPAVRSANNIVQWLPAEEIMTVRQTEDNFSMFEDRAVLEGSLIIRDGGLEGSGQIGLMDATLTSDSFLFKAASFSSDTSSLTLKMPARTDASLSAANLSVVVDIEEQTGNFSRNTGSEMISLHVNRYIANPENLVWNIDKKEFEFTSSAIDPESGLQGTKYISTEKGQDSVSFFSPHAVLDYGNDLLRASEVKYIEIADATIFPGDETIVAGERARILPLKQARITASRDNSYHEIYNALLEIGGKYNYNGSGDYDYTDELNQVQTIHFEKISVNGDTTTIASGNIPVQENFMLSPEFTFTGETRLNASRRYLNFNGGTEISHNCEGLEDQIIAFENEIDPMEVLIPVPDEPVSYDRERIYAGIFIATDSVHIYPAFFSRRKNWADQLIVTAGGYMKYDPPSNEYRIASLEQLRDPSVRGNYLSLNTKECIIRGEGSLNLGVTLGQFEINAVGKAHNEIEVNETAVEGILNMDFFMSEDAIALIAEQADSLPGQPLDSSAYYFGRGLNQLLGPERAESFKNSTGAESRISQLPDELEKTFVLSDINMKWNKETRSYQSRGKIGIAYINGVYVNKLYTGYLEITKRRSGDYADFYIELDNNNWYYFGYTRGVMQTFSSNPEYVNIIDELPLRHRRMRVSARETRYIYMLATDTKLEQFFAGYRRHLQGESGNLQDEELLKEEEETGDH
ncbi:MAG: hypothetical protein R6U58_11495 [Bacteroidales bacterium]